MAAAVATNVPNKTVTQEAGHNDSTVSVVRMYVGCLYLHSGFYFEMHSVIFVFIL